MKIKYRTSHRVDDKFKNPVVSAITISLLFLFWVIFIFTGLR